MEILVILFVAWILLGAIRRAVSVTSSSTITIHVTEIRRGDDDRPDPEPRPGPRDEPEIILANERAVRRRLEAADTFEQKCSRGSFAGRP